MKTLLMTLVAILACCGELIPPTEDQIRERCYSRGYSDVVRSGDQWWCVRIVNGNTEVVRAN